MYVRIINYKFPNELAKNAVKALAINSTKYQWENGLLMRYLVDINSNTTSTVLAFKNKEAADDGWKKFGLKFNKEVKEMGVIVSISEGFCSAEFNANLDPKQHIKII